jgi:hypothetical protein
MCSQNPLAERLGQNDGPLLSIGRRLGALESFVAELECVTRGKPFHIWSGWHWVLLLDSRDILVVHLASWAKSVWENNGLLTQITANHLRDLSRAWTADPGDRRDPHFHRLLRNAHEEAFDRLFPNAKGNDPAPDDVRALSKDFERRMQPLMADRNDNRAHPYEWSRKKGTVTMLELPTLREHFDQATRVINDLRLIGCSSTTGYSGADSFGQSVAADLVEAVLVGASSRIQLVRGSQSRDDFYAGLHAQHDALADPGKALFNDLRDEGGESP